MIAARAVCLLALWGLLLPALPALATDAIAARTGSACPVCHLDPEGGGDLAQAGRAYQADPARWRPPAAAPAVAPGAVGAAGAPGRGDGNAFRLLRLAVRFAHLFFSVLWLGTIFYIHIVLTPRYAFGGLPRKEVRLAQVSMPLVAATGALLVFWKMGDNPRLLSTRFGHLLVAKVAIFLSMLTVAVFVVRFVGPRLAARARAFSAAPDGLPGATSERAKESLTAEELAGCDGREGRRAFVAVDGTVYEVTGSRMWKEGSHARRHQAGQELGGALAEAPHGPEVLERMKRVGELSAAHERTPGIVLLFAVLAYYNLAAGAAILLLVALWKW